MDDLTNIWDADDEINEEQLLNYIKGKATEEEQRLVEKQMTDSDFVNDAVEGLQQFAFAGRLNDYVHELNKKMHQHLEEKKEKRKIKELSWIIIAVIVILLLCVLGYVVIRMKEGR